MAFNTNPGKQQFTATAGQTVFTFNFAIFANTDIKVYKTPSGQVANDTADLLTLSTNYTVSINGTLGGTVTLLVGAGLNDTITIVRNLPVSRTTDYQTNGDLYADTLDADQDYQTYLVQDGYVQLERAIILPESLSGTDVNIPAPVANSYLRWNATADALENDTSIPNDVVTTTNNVALTNADVVLTHADVVLTHADVVLAQKWATELEDVVVSGGQFSAFHWAMKAAASASTFLTVAEQTHAATSKATPVDADELPLADSEATFGLKKLTWANVKATLKTYFDTLYQAVLVSGTNIKTINGSSILGSGNLTVTSNPVLAEYTVAGSAVTSIDFSGLDINTHGGSYEIELRLKNATASISQIYCYVNNDTTNTNYYSQLFSAQAGTTSQARYNDPRIITLEGSSFSTGKALINLSNGYPRAVMDGGGLVGSSVSVLKYSMSKTATATNITQITLTASVASSIDIGSKVIIRRKDI